MEDNYFDKKLKGILESNPEFKPDQSAMLDMQNRLRAAQQPKKKRRGFFFLMPLLLLPILLGAGFFYTKYDKLNNQVNDLNQQILAIHQNLRSDTIIEKQVIHHYDTIHTVVYRERYIREDRPVENHYNRLGFQSPLYAASHLNTSSIYTPNILDWSIGKGKNSLFAKRPGSSVFLDDIWNNNSDPESETITNKFLAAEYIPPIGLQLISIDDRQDPDWLTSLKEQLPKEEEKKIKTAYYFVPTGFTFGVNASPFVLPFDAFGSQGNSFGLSGAIELPGGRSLEVGATFSKMNFEVKEAADFALFPIVDPTDPSDVLHEVKGNFSYLEIPIMLRQRFREDHKLKPFVTAGFVAYRPIAQDFVFEYLTGFNEYKLTSTFKNGVFSVDNLRFGLGAEYDLGKHISAASEVQYQHGLSLNADEYFKLRYFALNLGLRYRM